MLRVLQLGSTAAENAAGLAVLALMTGTTLDVISRATLGKSLSGVIEVSETLIVIVVFGAIAYAQRAGAHVSTSLIVDRLPATAARLVTSVGLIALVVFLIWISFATFEAAIDSYQTGEYRFGLVRIPIWPSKLAICIGVTLLLFEAIGELILSFNTGNAAKARSESPPAAPVNIGSGL